MGRLDTINEDKSKKTSFLLDLQTFRVWGDSVPNPVAFTEACYGVMEGAPLISKFWPSMPFFPLLKERMAERLTNLEE